VVKNRRLEYLIEYESRRAAVSGSEKGAVPADTRLRAMVAHFAIHNPIAVQVNAIGIQRPRTLSVPAAAPSGFTRGMR